MYREINPEVLYEIFNFWTPSANETIFKGIRQLSPGHWLKADKHGVSSEKEYWDIPFLSDYTNTPYSEDEFGDMLHELLKEATLLRLRADVPVGAYLSGGLDSSSITSLISLYSDNSLKTFSVTFTDEVYNEQKEQKQMVEFLKTDHHAVSCSYDTIAAVFPDVIWHTETPVLRTAPAPLYLLSALVRENNYKVVLTGEGADEILGGYDIFKEAKIRAFIRKNPESPMRALLLKRLYPHFALSPVKSVDYAKKIFNTEAYAESDIFYAHRPRWQVTKGTNIFLSKDITSSYKDPVEKLTDRFAAKLKGLDYFSQAQYLESKLLLANYLLSSQGDRMAMSHSVEGRFPFLDHRVVELACKMPPNYKMKVLNEKNILKKSMKNFLPKSILKRTKQPYMAPDILSFFKGDNPPEYLDYYLSESLIKEAGLFRPDAVRMLINKCRKKMRQGFRDNMAFTGILSAQILYDKFIKDFQVKTPQSLNNVRILS